VTTTTCTATRHAPTHTAYNHWGCRCPTARHAIRTYRKHLQAGHRPPHLHDATGTRRRIQALYAIGHTTHTIAPYANLTPFQIRDAARRRHVTAHTAVGIATAYNTLRHTPGPSTVNTARAHRHHWPTPADWDAWGPGHIDYPDQPDPVIDPVAIHRVITRQARLDILTPPEQAALYHQLRPTLTDGQIRHRLGLSAAQLHRITRHAERHPP